jgi:hypothetical protein
VGSCQWSVVSLSRVIDRPLTTENWPLTRPGSYRVFLLTITPALKFVSRFGWLRTHSE